MRCPKCHYLSFDPEPRCKNCGYDLEVTDAELAFKAAEDYSDPVLDLELRRTDPMELAPVTLELRPEAMRLEPVLPDDEDDVWPARSTPIAAAAVADRPAPMAESTFRIEPVRENIDDAAGVMPAQRERSQTRTAVAEPPVSAHPTTELPLFVRDAPAPPRAPLSVRRTMAEPPRARTTTGSESRAAARDLRVGPLDRDLLDDLRRVEREEAAFATAQARVAPKTGPVGESDSDLDDDPEDIPATQRLAAAAIDGVLLGGIGTVALWATLRVTGASITSFGTDAIVAFLIFIGGVSVAYLLMFTAAGGQTVGKMLMGLRVVGDTVDSIDDQLTMAQAALRAVLAPLSVLALGLGWLPALFGRGLALHDRLAHTRVIRA